MGYGYAHPNAMPGSFGVPGWGYPAYEQAEPMPRGPAMPYYADPSAAYGARAPGGSRDRSSDKYGQGAAATDAITAQATGVCVLYV